MGRYLQLPGHWGFIYGQYLTISSKQASALVTTDQEVEGSFPMALQDTEELQVKEREGGNAKIWESTIEILWRYLLIKINKHR